MSIAGTLVYGNYDELKLIDNGYSPYVSVGGQVYVSEKLDSSVLEGYPSKIT